MLGTGGLLLAGAPSGRGDPGAGGDEYRLVPDAARPVRAGCLEDRCRRGGHRAADPRRSRSFAARRAALRFREAVGRAPGRLEADLQCDRRVAQRQEQDARRAVPDQPEDRPHRIGEPDRQVPRKRRRSCSRCAGPTRLRWGRTRSKSRLALGRGADARRHREHPDKTRGGRIGLPFTCLQPARISSGAVRPCASAAC